MSAVTLYRYVPEINSWLLAAVFFSIPTQIAPAYILSLLMLVLWLVEGNRLDRLKAVFRNRALWMLLAYYAIVAASLLWTEDIANGQRMLRKATFFLLAPLYFSVARKEHFNLYLGAFLSAIVLCELLAFYNWLHLNYFPELPDGIRVDKDPMDTAPFVDRIMYAPILAWAGYLAGQRAFFPGHRHRALYFVLLVTTTINLVISGGRAGMVAFLVMLGLLVIQRIKAHITVALPLAFLTIALVVTGAYTGNRYFQKRVDAAIANVSSLQEDPNTSVGLRLSWARTAWRIFLENPLIGVGAGDFPSYFLALNAQLSPAVTPTWNPHNQFLFTLSTLGIVGGIAFIAMLVPPPLWRARGHGEWQRLRDGLPVFFAVICLSESYLIRSNTALLFVLCMTLLYAAAPPADQDNVESLSPQRKDLK